MKTRWAVALAAAALMVSLQARAQVGPPSPGRNPQRTSDAIKTVLDLTDRQFNELNDLRDAHNQKLQDLSARMRDLDKQRRDAMAAGDNAALVGSLALQLQQLQQQMQLLDLKRQRAHQGRIVADVHGVAALLVELAHLDAQLPQFLVVSITQVI